MCQVFIYFVYFSYIEVLQKIKFIFCAHFDRNSDETLIFRYALIMFFLSDKVIWDDEINEVVSK